MSEPEKKTKSNENAGTVGFAALVLGLLTTLGAYVYGATDPEGAKQVISPIALSQVEITGKGSALACRGWYRTEFSAVNSKNEKVEGVVCNGPKFINSDADATVIFKLKK